MKFATRTHRMAYAAAAVVIVAGAAWSAPGPLKSGILEYEMEMTPQNRPAMKMGQRIWFKGERFRMEMTTPQGKRTQIGGPDGMYLLMPGTNQATKFSVPNVKRPKGSIPGVPFGDISAFKKQKKVGSEKVGAYQADIYEQTMNLPSQAGMPKSSISTRVWISPSLPVPVKIVSKMPQMQQVMVLKSAKLNASVPDSMLQLPKGTKVTEQKLPAMGGGRPGQPSPR